ncbi:MAG: shikimate dehydrogenase [Gemmatimonadetes bacterium]|nr:MAG: shikimate dehydrogenase [Gemmatimonadota bacterium]
MSDLPGRLVLLGHPVSHSLSPRFQNAALRAAGIPLVYEALDVAPEALAATLADLARQDASGNVTIPHKEAVAELCTRRSALADRCGAVNTFWHEDGALVGDNTDVGGVDAIAHALLGDARTTARVALLGAGGSAAAVLAAAERWGAARVRLYNRNMERARALASRFDASVDVAPSVEAALDGATLVVNATPVGLRDDAHPVAVDLLPTGAAVFDLVYRSGETAWVRAARNAGHRAADGEGMLVEQGALSFERWFGIEPDRNAMWSALH